MGARQDAATRIPLPAAPRNFGRKKRATKFRTFHDLRGADDAMIVEHFFLVEENHVMRALLFQDL